MSVALSDITLDVGLSKAVGMSTFDTTMRAWFPLQRHRHPSGSLVQGRAVQMDITVGGSNSPMSEQTSRYVQTLAVHGWLTCGVGPKQPFDYAG